MSPGIKGERARSDGVSLRGGGLSGEGAGVPPGVS